MKQFHTNAVSLNEVANARSAFAAKSKDPLLRDLSCRPRREFATRTLSVIFALLLLSTFAAAQTLTGTVKNATTGKPSVGDDVVLLSLSQGMDEAGRTKTDAKGNFSFKLDQDGPHLIRAIHEGVTYHHMAPPGTTSVEVDVYDAAKKVDGVEVVADIMRIQAEQGQLEIMRAFAVQNNSKPARTQMNERNLEFYVPEGAKIIEGSALTQGGNPLTTMPVPVDDKKTRYAFNFPLRPGTTQFQIAYQLAYDGSANIDPKSLYPLQHFVAIMPKGMQFVAAPGTAFKPMNDPQQPDAEVEVASGAQTGQALAFKITGEGTLQAREENAGQPSEGGGAAQTDTRPGGGLGPPIDAPPPTQKYQWWILGALALALTVGGVYVASRQQAAARTQRKPGKTKFQEPEFEADYEEAEVEAVPARGAPTVGSNAAPARPATLGDAKGSARIRDNGGRRAVEASPSAPRPQGARTSSSMLLEGLKEELFQLEVEHKQGIISQQEYEQAKAALDQTLQRALKRESQKA